MGEASWMEIKKKDRKRELAMGKTREGARRTIIGMDDQKCQRLGCKEKSRYTSEEEDIIIGFILFWLEKKAILWIYDPSLIPNDFSGLPLY